MRRVPVALAWLLVLAWIYPWISTFALPNPARDRQIAKFNAAVEAGSTPEVREMLRHRNSFGLANAYKVGEPPLYLAAEHGHADIVHMLLKARADKDRGSIHDGATPLKAAAGHGHAEIVSLLLAAGADSNGTSAADSDFYASSPLFDAADGGHSDVVRLLLEARADKDSTSPCDCSALLGLQLDLFSTHQKCAGN